VAIRKETIKQQYAQAMAPALEPGEQVLAGVMSQSGPSPWLTGAIGILLMLAFGLKMYFVAVTDRRVVFWRGSLWSQRPQGLAWADPRGAATITDVVADAKLWNSFRYARPGEGKPTRFNVSNVIWKDEYRQLIALLTGSGGVAMPPPPPTP
jgi:hypothetical protein